MRCAWIFLGLALAACDDSPPRLDVDASARDAGRRDAGLDAGRVDAADAGESDGALPYDAATETIRCVAIDEVPLELGRDTRASDRQIAIAPGPDHFGVAWPQSPIARDEVRFARIPSHGSFASVAVDVGEAPLARDLALGRTDVGWILAWSDTDLGNYEIRAQVLAADGAVTGAASRLTDNALRDTDTSLVVTDEGGVLAAWIEIDGDGRRALARRVDATTGAGIGAPTVVADSVGALALGLGLDGPTAYWERERHAFLSAISSTGAPTGTTLRLDSEANVTGPLDLTRAGGRAAAIFGVTIAGARAEVRFRPLATGPAADGPERQLTPAPEQGRGASIAPLGGGYAVAYRALDGARTRVRLALVDVRGERVASLDLPETSVGGGTVALAVAGDGRLLVVYFDRSEGGAQRVLAIRVECGDA